MVDPGMAPLQQARAEEVALEALAWIAADEDLLGAFLAQTGTEAGEIRRAAADPAFLGGVLDFLLAEDARVLAFARAHAIAPDQPMRARAALPGGDAPHWI